MPWITPAEEHCCRMAVLTSKLQPYLLLRGKLPLRGWIATSFSTLPVLSLETWQRAQRHEIKRQSLSSKYHFQTSSTEVSISEGHYTFQSQAEKRLLSIYLSCGFMCVSVLGMWVAALPVNQISLCKCTQLD